MKSISRDEKGIEEGLAVSILVSDESDEAFKEPEQQLLRCCFTLEGREEKTDTTLLGQVYLMVTGACV